MSSETCPHYLTFAADEVPDGATEFKCAPPIRSAQDRDRLWAALFDRAIDLVATDHSPAPPALKHRVEGDFRAAWGGIASLQLALPAVWTAGRARGAAVEDVARWATHDLRPHLTVVLDLEPEDGLRRFAGRDRIEGESLAFHQRVREGFLAMAKADPDHYLVLDGRADVDEIAATIREQVEQL